MISGANLRRVRGRSDWLLTLLTAVLTATLLARLITLALSGKSR